MRNLGRWTGLPVLALLVALPAMADDVVVRTFPFEPGDRLEMEVEGGNIEYEIGRSGEITVHVIAHEGAVADYIPQLGAADPRSFGIAVATVRLWGRGRNLSKSSGAVSWGGEDEYQPLSKPPF